MMDMALEQITLHDYGVEIQHQDPIIIELQQRLSRHTTPESIKHINYMIAVEERLLKMQIGQPYLRCKYRLELYRDQLAKIDNSSALAH
jgi:hypothetical protein